ncbi:hypothetical protein NHX12_022380 [Muraenolepis orangiensis]|uniref:Uncharacterized protein n=1 Tax=Muraenolepis orangiensis TaxID=630683 RepID=A0A9Q0IR85_9TELE|nr:hypothetical protein NHX12_022380 [Muraenolepis orangiensis]
MDAPRCFWDSKLSVGPPPPIVKLNVLHGSTGSQSCADVLGQTAVKGYQRCVQVRPGRVSFLVADDIILDLSESKNPLPSQTVGTGTVWTPYRHLGRGKPAPGPGAQEAPVLQAWRLPNLLMACGDHPDQVPAAWSVLIHNRYRLNRFEFTPIRSQSGVSLEFIPLGYTFIVPPFIGYDFI